jgi:chemotaxis protein methyltransferase CheR
LDQPSDQWEQLRQWAEAETGMDLSGSRAVRLREAVDRVLGHPAAPVDLHRVLTDADARAAFFEQLTGRLTVGESFFLRNEHHFRALREFVFPEILRENEERREIRVWSAGCATGEEPYSLAIMLDQILAEPFRWNVSVLGTDLNPEFLRRAREGVYRRWSFRGTMIQSDPRYFAQEEDQFRLTNRVARHVRFGHLNLVKDPYPSPLNGTLGLDLILFRNVAIYLRPEVTRAVIARLRDSLRPGGWLLLGETEVSLAETSGFEVRRFHQATFHRKPADAEPFLMAEDQARPSVLSALPLSANPGDLPSTALPSLKLSPPAPLPQWSPLPKRERGLRSHPPAVVPRRQGAEELWDEVHELMRSNRLNDAEVLLNGLDSADQRSRLRLMYARELLGRSELTRARGAVSLAIRENPLLIEGWLLQASLSEEAGELEAAEQAYRRALYLDRNCTIAHFHLGLLRQQSGDAAGAVRCLRTTVRLSQEREPQAVVEYGDGVCYGRLRELAMLMSGMEE